MRPISVSMLAASRRFVCWAALAIGCLSSARAEPAAADAPPAVAPHRTPSPDRWESAIAAYEGLDREHPPTPGGIWLLGSSNIRLWSTLETDFQGLHVKGRGVGGCRLAELADFASRLVAAAAPCAIVISAGTNDLNAGATATEVRDAFVELVANLKQVAPDATIAFLAIAPSIKRWEQFDRQRAANAAVREFVDAADDPRLQFLDANEAFLGRDGRPDPACFVDDKLHPSVAGNARRAALLRPVFAELLHTAVPKGSTKQMPAVATGE
jgi:lysophospholipase L1-like esterase